MVKASPVVERMWMNGTNPFNLPQPPVWWLEEIQRYDPELVIFPSAVEPKYRLARRRFNTRGMISVQNVTTKHPDSVFMDAMGLIPIVSFAHTGTTWASGTMLDYLQRNDIWARGGADVVADQLDEADAKAEAANKANIRADMDYRSRDAWRSYNARAGSRNKSARDGSRHAYARRTDRIVSRPTRRQAPEPAWVG